jgi:hypothetical protein
MRAAVFLVAGMLLAGCSPIEFDCAGNSLWNIHRDDTDHVGFD